MKDSVIFLLSKNKIFIKIDFSHIPYWLDKFFFCLFYLNGKWFMYKGGLVGRASPLLSKKKKKICCEASDLHSVVRRINVEPFPFDVCEQLPLSDCKMQLIIVYSDSQKNPHNAMFLYIWTWDCHVHEHNPETLRRTSRVPYTPRTLQVAFLK